MRFVLFTARGSAPTAGVLVERGVISLPRHAQDAQAEMVHLIDHFDELRLSLESLATQPDAIPVSEVQLLPPLPRPGKILCSTATYGSQHAEPPQLLFTLKSAESIIGPGETVHLPDVADEWSFVAEAELGLVIKGPAKRVSARDWRSAVFGYTCVIDVMARGDTTFGRDLWLAKSDSLGPVGPCIVTADEVLDPQSLQVRSLINGAPAQSYSMSDADHSVAEQIELATTVMTLHTGDVIACGTSPTGLQTLAGGDEIEVDIERVGRLAVRTRAKVRV